MRIIVFLMVLSFPILIAAQRITLSLEGAYAISAPNSFLGIQESQVFIEDFSISNLRGSYGAGLVTGIEVGIAVNSNISFGLGYGMLNGPATRIYYMEQNNFYDYMKATTIQHRFVPSIQFTIPGKKVDFFMQTGLIIPLKTITNITEDFSGLDATTDVYKYEIQDQYNFDFGFQQGIGVSFKLSEHFTLSGNFQGTLLNLIPKKRIVKNYSVNDQDQIQSLSTFEKETLYHKDLNNFSNNDTYNPLYETSKAKDELEFSRSFNSLSFGLKIIFKIK